MISIDNYDFKGKRAIIRVDFNVPLNEKGEVTDDTRIRAAMPTVKKVLAGGGSVILMSHMGRPKKNPDPKYSLEQIVPAVEKNLGVKVEFAGDCMGEKAAEMAKALKPGQVMLLENLRFYAEEEGKPRGLAEDATKEEKEAAKKALKEGPQKEFVQKLASYADCYINDAFGTAHRKHASTYLIAKKFPNDKMFGYLMEKEVKAISSLMEAPAHPFCAIIGGSKVSSKIGVIKALIEKVDSIVIGGGMTYTFAAAQGGKVGDSICEPDMFPVALEILELAKKKGVELVMSPDALIADAFSADANTNVAPANNIPDGWEGVDIADEGKKAFRDHILSCKTILWNGPVGVFEIDKFATGSKEVALAIAEATISTYKAAQAAYAQGMEWGGPVVGAIMAATAVAAGMARVAAIKSTPLKGFAFGGLIGGQDKGERADNVLIRATPGEYMLDRPTVRHYGVSALEALRRRSVPRELLEPFASPRLPASGGKRTAYALGGEIGNGSLTEGGKASGNEGLTVINVMDFQREFDRALASTRGRRVLINILGEEGIAS